MRSVIHERLLMAMRDQVFPGCVVGVVREGGQREIITAGRFTYDAESPRVRDDTIFDVASITKAIPASCLALQLLDEGRLELNERLVAYVSEMRQANREDVLIRHLLTQTLRYDFRLSNYARRSPAEILNVIFTSEFKSPPGTVFNYANATSILLGLVVERVLGMSLDHAADLRFFTPLGMTRTTFHPLEKFAASEIVPTEIQGWRGGVIQGVVHDDSAYVLSSKQVVGSAGLFSCVPDLLTFAEMLLGGGTYQGATYFSEAMLKQMHTNQIANIGESTGLGWELHQPWYMGTHGTEHTFGKTGFTGCALMIDRDKGFALAMLSNATYPTRNTSREPINAVRRDIADIVFGGRG